VEALRRARKALFELPGVRQRKCNVRAKARAFQEQQLRNYVAYVGIFNAFANDPRVDAQLSYHLFVMMDMLCIEVKQQADNVGV
jgi:hypothetical protein